MNVTVIGAGLAGCEAAWQLAQRGISVTLREMKPDKMTPAHHRPGFAELVCSNSLRSDQLENAAGLLKEELRRCGSLILRCAGETRVEAGGALAVDREGFSAAVTEAVRAHPGITVAEGEVTAIPDGEVVIASGPLTSDALSQAIAELFPENSYLNFYDAAAPIVTFDSIDMDHAWFASRYDKGTADYINCALSEEEYLTFWKELTGAEEAEVRGFEDKNVFEGCMPVEVMARRGVQTLAFGPLKPKGLPDPKTGREPYAVVQLRRDNAAGTLYNLVGFQTHLKWGEQKRVFSLIPALKHAEYVRYGVMHRNTYLNLRGPDHRGGGLCGVHRVGLPGGGGAGKASAGAGAAGLPPGDGYRRAGPVREPGGDRGLPAHEREFRHHAPAGSPGEGQAGEERRPVPAGVGCDRRAEREIIRRPEQCGLSWTPWAGTTPRWPRCRGPCRR